MNRAEPRIIRAKRLEAVPVPCEPRDRSTSCGAMTPFAIRGKCEACGKPQRRQHAPEPSEDTVVYHGDVLVVDDDTDAVVAGQLVAVEEICDSLMAALDGLGKGDWFNIKTTSSNRMSGILNTSVTFGTSAPAPLRRRWGCGPSVFDRRHPEITGLITDALRVGNAMLELHAPQAHEFTTAAADRSLKETWRLGGLPWTSGVINKSSALPYHRDSGNLKGTWSAMLGMKRDIAGGHLHLGDYDVWLGIPHGSICIFDGQSVLHGVSPIHPESRRAERYTIVAYAKSGVASCCEDPQEEVRRAAILATESAERIARTGLQQASRDSTA